MVSWKNCRYNSDMQLATYEDRFGALRRRVDRVWRGVKWRVKAFTGAPRHILVEICWRLGDEIMAIPIYEALRKAYAPCRITVLCMHPELLEGNPYVDSVNPPDVVDRYILLRSDARAIPRIAHYARLAGVPTPAARPSLYYSDWPTPVLDAANGPIVALSPGASWSTKRWPQERWRALARLFADSGHTVVELGRGDERIGVGTSLVDKTSVRDAACVLRAACLMVCCDSGLMHLALAVGTPVVALFGPTDPDMLVPDDANLVAVRGRCDRPGCWNRSGQSFEPGTCPETSSPPGTDAECMTSISVKTVFDQAQELLGRTHKRGAV